MVVATGYPVLLSHVFEAEAVIKHVDVKAQDTENAWFNMQMTLYNAQQKSVGGVSVPATGRHARLSEPFTVEKGEKFYIEISVVKLAGRFIYRVEYDLVVPKKKAWGE